jgi:predicted nucleic acid-binding protein
VSLVLDSSVALTWCFEDEHTPVAAALLDQIAENGAVAPALWPLEVLNGLVMAERRGRLDAARRHQLASFLRDLPIKLDHETAAQTWTATAGLAERFRLTLYDAAYLELAQRLGLPLASLDQELRVAGGALGIPLLGT